MLLPPRERKLALVWCYSVWDVFKNFLLIDATDRSKISSDQKRFFIALSLYPLSFFANTPFNKKNYGDKKKFPSCFKKGLKGKYFWEISRSAVTDICVLYVFICHHCIKWSLEVSHPVLSLKQAGQLIN